MKLVKILLFSFFICSFNIPIVAQSRMEINYTMEDGLPSNFVYRAVQDTAGYIWFCTDKGVAKFDGTSFRTFDVSDGLPHNDIFDIGKDSYGKLWLSTFDSICYIKNDSIHYLSTSIPRSDAPIIHKLINGDNHFIEIRSNGRTVLAEKDDVLTKINSPRSGGFPLDVKSENDFTIIDRQDFKQKIQQFKDGIPTYSRRISSSTSTYTYGQILIDNNHYIFESDSVYIWTGELVLKHAYEDLWNVNPQIYSVKQFNSNIIIQGYEKNVVVDKKLNIKDSLTYLLNKDFNSFIQDSDGNVWLCTNNGVTYISNNNLASIKNNIPDQDDSFIKLVKDQNGKIYIASKAGKLFKLEKDQTLHLVKDFKTEKIKDIAFYEEKNSLFYFDLDKGIFSLDLESPEAINTYKELNKSLNYGSVKSIDVSDKGDIVMSKSQGVYVYTDDKVKELIGRRSYASTFSGDDIFLGTMSGLFMYSRDSIERISDDNFSYVIHNLFTDNNGGLWIAPNNKGLWKYQENSISEIPEVGQLYVNNLTQDENNIIWLATTKGLYNLHEDRQTGKYTLNRYGNSYGIIEDNIVDISYSNEYIFAATKKHLYTFKNSSSKIAKDSKFHFTETYANNVSKTSDHLLDLSHLENNIEIKFNTISYSDLGEFTYQWKLLPTNQEWQKTNESALLFNSLSPGEYSLLINVAGSEGNVLHENQELRFTINNPWYDTNLFYIICSCLLLYLFYFFSKRMESAQRKKSDAEYHIQKQFYELRLKAVQAQMNPHFLFNTLNSIQKFIYQKSPEEANQYIVQLAKLMRQVLESTSKNYSTLSEEILLLKNYISLEQLRFADSFDFHLNIESGVIPNEIKIPSTILQPFVENSINHGLANKDGKGNLWLRFGVDQNKLVCEIEDDGVGRDTASKTRSTKHKSRALDIIRERKEVLLRRDNYDLDFYYNDLVSDGGNVSGTKLTLTIPVIND